MGLKNENTMEEKSIVLLRVQGYIRHGNRIFNAGLMRLYRDDRDGASSIKAPKNDLKDICKNQG